MTVDWPLLPFFFAGLLSGGHCAGMCGGMVSAFSHLPIAQQTTRQRLVFHLACNGGRLASYAVAGLLVGGLGQLLNHLHAAQLALYGLAQIMLILMGAYLIGFTKLLAPLERSGQIIWQRLQPLIRLCLPIRTPAQAVVFGLLWGWLPCGLVYSALTSALSVGSATGGALLMLTFGLGTLPNLLLAGLLLARFTRVTQHRWLRSLVGLLIMGYGLWGLWRGLPVHDLHAHGLHIPA